MAFTQWVEPSTQWVVPQINFETSTGETVGLQVTSEGLRVVHKVSGGAETQKGVCRFD